MAVQPKGELLYFLKKFIVEFHRCKSTIKERTLLLHTASSTYGTPQVVNFFVFCHFFSNYWLQTAIILNRKYRVNCKLLNWNILLSVKSFFVLFSISHQAVKFCHSTDLTVAGQQKTLLWKVKRSACM